LEEVVVVVPFVVGPVVLMVSVVVATAPSITVTVGGLNEQSGEGSTGGVIELHAGVTLPAYPSVEVIFRTAVAPLPAGTLLGLTVVPTVRVYSGETAMTVMGFSVTLCVRLPEAPVTVTVYCVGGVRPVVVKLSEGDDGGVEIAGLTVQVGGLVGSTGVMAQDSETGLLNPLVDPRVIVAPELMPGSTAEGLGAED
jgi:hypothetical protein